MEAELRSTSAELGTSDNTSKLRTAGLLRITGRHPVAACEGSQPSVSIQGQLEQRHTLPMGRFTVHCKSV